MSRKRTFQEMAALPFDPPITQEEYDEDSVAYVKRALGCTDRVHRKCPRCDDGYVIGWGHLGSDSCLATASRKLHESEDFVQCDWDLGLVLSTSTTIPVRKGLAAVPYSPKKKGDEWPYGAVYATECFYVPRWVARVRQTYSHGMYNLDAMLEILSIFEPFAVQVRDELYVFMASLMRTVLRNREQLLKEGIAREARVSMLRLVIEKNIEPWKQQPR